VRDAIKHRANGYQSIIHSIYMCSDT
jgi:hypothetical protein